MPIAFQHPLDGTEFAESLEIGCEGAAGGWSWSGRALGETSV